jgi:hypothetical protein
MQPFIGLAKEMKMKKIAFNLMAMMMALGFSTASYASCRTSTIMLPNGTMMICTTCCYGNGNCTTTCV